MGHDPGPEPLVPQVSSDEDETGWGELPDADDDDRLRREVPPHHGD